MAPILNEQILHDRLRAFHPSPLIPPLKSPQPPETSTVPPAALDLATTNFLNLLSHPRIAAAAESAIRAYGVGTCGPRAFYGTTDAHLELEERLARFLRLEEAIVYSYGFVAISSSIAAYCARSDVVFVDERANAAIVQGVRASRSRVVRFAHNDSGDFARQAALAAGRRAFLVVEGVSWASGRLLPLERFLAVAEAHKMRVFLEESRSLGVLGRTGRGLTEHCGVDPSRVDMIVATLEGAVGSIGGFCAGSKLVIEHQRLSGSGYIFSASLPTYLARTAVESLEMMEDGVLVGRLARLAGEVHRFLVDECKFEVGSYEECAFKVISGARNREIYEFCRREELYCILNEEGDLVVNLNVELADDGEKLERIYTVFKKASFLLNN